MLNKRLLSERERLKMSQADLAKECEVTVTTQSNYETGRRVPDANYLANAYKAGVDVKYVVTGERCENDQNKKRLEELEAMIQELLQKVQEMKKT